MSKPDLTTLARSDLPIRALLDRAGRVFRTEFPNDSGNEVFGVECEGGRFFVKHSDRPQRVAAFRRVEHLYARVRHEALPTLRSGFPTPEGYALVFDWVEAEHYAHDAARARFAARTTAEKLRAFETVLDLHVRLEEAGFVAEDLYDGCFLYDFAARRLYVCDLDEYHAGAFVLDRERTFGSTRFMAPEEWVRGALIDGRTNVYNLARVAAVLLGDRAGSAESFCGPPAMQSVLARATRPAPQDRFPSVRAFAEAWGSETG
jgi:serine/threonine-protein kinase